MVISRLIISGSAIWLLAILVTTGYSQTEKPDPPSEGFADTLKRLQIKREIAEHEKLVKGAQQAADLASTLSLNCSAGRLEKAAEKKLREIEKSARQIRRSIGSDDGDEGFEVPDSLDDGVRRLAETSKLLGEQMNKTSRHVMSVGVLASANNVLRLTRFLRGFL